MRLVWQIVEKSVPESGPGEVVTDDTEEGAADQGAVVAATTRDLVRHAHEQVDVLDVGVRPLQLFYALKNVYKDNLMDFREYFFV